MVLPTSAPPYAPTRSVTARSGPLPAPASTPGTTFRQRVELRKRDNHADDPGRRGKKPSARPLEAERDKPFGLLARADGSLVIPAGLPALLAGLNCIGPGSAPRHSSLRETPGPLTQPMPRPAIQLADVRVGGSPGEAQVHARIAAGPHAGVELRAIERNGRVAIELVAGSGAEARLLRAEMGEIREVLAARGLDTVTVDVRSGDDERRERQREAFEASDERAPDERDPAVPALDGATIEAGELIL